MGKQYSYREPLDKRGPLWRLLEDRQVERFGEIYIEAPASQREAYDKAQRLGFVDSGGRLTTKGRRWLQEEEEYFTS